MSIRSVVRAFSVFDCFDSDSMQLTLHEISQKLELPKSTTFRLVNTLVELGYLFQLSDQRYCISFKLLRLSSLVPSVMDIREVAGPVIRELRDQTRETVSISILNGVERIVLDVIESRSTLKSISSIGETVGLQTGSVGRVFLAFNPTLPLDEIYGDEGPPPTLEEELKQIRSQGYACSTGDRVPGSAGISAPILDQHNAWTHCISIAGPEGRVVESQEEFSKFLVASAKRISDRFGA